MTFSTGAGADSVGRGSRSETVIEMYVPEPQECDVDAVDGDAERYCRTTEECQCSKEGKGLVLTWRRQNL